MPFCVVSEYKINFQKEVHFLRLKQKLENANMKNTT